MIPPSTSTRAEAIRMEGVASGAMRDQALLVTQDVNWTVAQGDYWVVAGLQGSGKSDFLMMTAGLMPLLAGEYRLFGEPMPIFEEARLQERLRLGLVFEAGHLFNYLTVAENIALPLRYHRNLSAAEASAAVQEMLALMELEPWATSMPGAIGRQWQKRTVLARALMLKPEILLVDDPLAGLDLRHTNWWLNFLDQLSRGHPFMEGKGQTLVVSATALRPWKDRARQFAVLKDRRLAVLGDWAHLDREREWTDGLMD